MSKFSIFFKQFLNFKIKQLFLKLKIENSKIFMRYKLCVMRSGFTLAELMIVIAIVGIFSGLTIINFRGNSWSKEINNQALLLFNGVKTIQTASLSGRIIDSQVPVAYRFSLSSCVANCQYSLQASTTLALIPINGGVLLDKSSIEIVDANQNSLGNNLIIEASPPRGRISISVDDNLVPDNEVQIKLTHLNNAAITKTVRINGISGRMDILKQ